MFGGGSTPPYMWGCMPRGIMPGGGPMGGGIIGRKPGGGPAGGGRLEPFAPLPSTPTDAFHCYITCTGCCSSVQVLEMASIP